MSLTDCAPIAGLDATASLAAHAMAEAHDRKLWDKCVAVGEAWIDARGGLPPVPATWYAQSLMGVHRYADAVPWASIAVKGMPSTTTADKIAQCAARACYAQSLSRVGRYAQAKRVLKDMTATAIDHPETMEKQGHILLAISEKWAQGWAMHEQRESNRSLPDGYARWDGQAQGRVAVLHEQGIGDAVLFARWLDAVAERSGNPVTWFGPEQVLARWMGGLSDRVTAGDRTNPPPVDFACYAMSLPHLIGCPRPRAIPAPVAPRELLARRANRTAPDQLTVGVCWKGSKDGWHDFERSFTAAEFLPVLSVPKVTFVNLTHDAPIAEGMPFAPVTFPDLYACGAVVADLDLVVTVDTSVAHVAGSLGVPTVVIAPTVPDWRYRWPRGGESPFYPSQTVVRRQHAADTSVLDAVRHLVERIVR